MYIDEDLVIPDMKGKVLILESDSFEAKKDALYNILKRLLEI